MISSSERSTYQVARSAEEAARIILRFYSVYHSLRYVGDRVVLRLQRPLPDAAAGQLSREFRDVLTSGAIQQGQALPEEPNEPELQHLPRLTLRFNRRDYGRLIDLVHRINQLGEPSGGRGTSGGSRVMVHASGAARGRRRGSGFPFDTEDSASVAALQRPVESPAGWASARGELVAGR